MKQDETRLRYAFRVAVSEDGDFPVGQPVAGDIINENRGIAIFLRRTRIPPINVMYFTKFTGAFLHC